MKVREVIKIIRADGWEQVAQKGSHKQFKHASKRGRVTVPGKDNDTLHPKTLKSILRQAGLTE